MKIIFLDNYRGFSKASIPLTSVNFLVGENSTGKTSFLSALKVMGSPRFWFNPTFDDPDLNFSSFSEIISKKSENKKQFTIGFYDSNDDDVSSDEKMPILRLITFKNEEGVPAVHRYSFMSPIGLISTIITDSMLRYKVHDCTDSKSPDCSDLSYENLLDICMSAHNGSTTSGYKQFTEKNFPRQLFFANAYHFIVADMAGKNLLKENKKRISFELSIDAPECRWIAPIRAKPERIYSSQTSDYSAEGSHIPILLNKILGSSSKDKEHPMLKALNEFGVSSGLFSGLKIKRYGREASSPFQVNVDLEGSELLVSNVGYGVSQVLPIVLEARRKSGADYIAIQQPEVHLHPKAQAYLGEFIYNSKKIAKNNFVIETHSDYLIDRFRLCTSKDQCLDAQVLFFRRTSEGNQVDSLVINENGSYPDEQPPEFREFFLNEELELLRL